MHQVLPGTVNDSTSSLQAAIMDATVQLLEGRNASCGLSKGGFQAAVP